MSAISALDGPEEAVVVSKLLVLRDRVSGRLPLDTKEEADRLVEEAMAAVNDYFHRRLIAVPDIAEYIDKIAASDEQH
jgi:hypothetical protein